MHASTVFISLTVFLSVLAIGISVFGKEFFKKFD